MAIISIAAIGCGGVDRSGVGGFDHDAAAVTSTGPLTLTMAAAGPLVQGMPTAYTVTVTNTTANPITQVIVAADFPGAALNQIPAGCVRIGGGQPQFICSIPSIAPGATLVFGTQIRPEAAGTLTFGAGVSSGGAELNFVDDVENVAPAPTDVQVTGSSSTGSPPFGSAFTCTFQVKNDGPFATLGGVSFANALPASLAFLGVTTNVGSCIGGTTVSCALGDLAVGAQAIIQISVRAPAAPQTIVDTASIAIGQQTDKNLANNSVSVTVTPK